MKTTTMRSRIVQTLCLLALAVPVSLQAQSGTYTNEVSDPVGLWSTAANWLGGTVADGSGNTATFSGPTGVAPVRLDLDSARTIGNLSFPQTNYTIYNTTNDANVLTLAAGATPVITVATGVTATIQRTVLAGTGGFVVDGGGQLSLWKDVGDPANTLTGSVSITNGSTLQITATDINLEQPVLQLALASLGSITLANGTLNLRTPQHTSFANGVASNNLVVPAGFTGTLFLPVRFTGSLDDGAPSLATAGPGFGGNLTGAGTLNVNVRYVRGAIVGDWSAFTGQMNVQHDAVQDAGVHHFRLGNPAGLPNASVDLGGTLNFSLHYYRGILSNTVYRIGALTGANPTVTLDGSATPGTGATNTLIFEVGVLRTNATNIDTFAGSIVNGVGPARFVKKGAHTLILTGTNSTHTGGTVVESGILQIGDGVNEVGTIGTGPVTNHSALVFARAGNLSVPGAVSGAGVITNNGVAGSTVTLSGANTYTNATYVNSGKLSISGATRSPTTYNIGNGATFGIAFSALNPTATNSSVVFGTGCTNDYNFGTVNSPTSAPVVTNTSVTLGGDVTVNVTGDDLTVGTITLLSYGSRSGAGNFVLGSLPSYITSYTFNDDTVNKRVTLTITVITDPTLRYVGNANGIWDIGNTANQIWVEVGTGNPTNYYDGAKVRFDDSATGNTTITLGAIVTPFSITVSNTTKAYTFTDPSGSSYTINGAGRFIKLGTNQVTIADMQNNAYSGTVNVEAGTLKLGDGTNNANIGTGNLTNNSVVVVDSGGSVPVVGFLGIGATIPNPIHGTGRVEVINTNVLTTPNILNGASTYSGGLTVKPGANIGYNNGNSAGIGGGMRIEDATVTVGATIAGNIGTILVIGNATFVNTAGRQIDAVIAVTNGTVTFNKTALMTINANMHGIVGTITNIGGANNQQLRFNNSGANNATGSSNALWVLAPSTLLAPRNGSVNFLGALTGEGILGGPSGADGLATYNIGGLNTDTVFTGYITNNTATRNTAIIKVGTGTLVLSNAVITHTGTTRVNSGTLAYKGSSQPANSTNITVASPGILDVTGRTDGTLSLGSAAVQALMGDGTINGIVTLGASARLAPGFSVGTLTSSGAFTIGGVSTFEIDGASTNADRIIAPSIVYGGTLNLVTNGNPVTGTRTYKLFQGSLSGTFSTITTQAIAGVTWDLSTLNSAGTVTVTGPAGPPTTPTNITVSISGSQLTLSWPSNYTGWTLQTNAAGVDSPTNWFAYPGSTGTNQITVNIDKTKKNVYYRMQIIP